MPSDSEHFAVYERHLRAYTSTVDGHPDWAAVILFYCAVHQVERLFALANRHSQDHGDREYQLKKSYQSFYHHYRALMSESLKTRYLINGPFTMTAARVKSKLHDERLQAIVADIEGRIRSRQVVPAE